MDQHDRRVADLLPTMTLEEKVPQLSSMIPTALIGPDGIRADVAQANLAHGIGYLEPFSGGFPVDAAELARLNNLV